jgi:hydrogenase nickel incorporation protein HypB
MERRFNMIRFRTIQIKQGILAHNDTDARILRERLAEERVFLLNLMGSPGAGKTAVLIKTIHALKKEMLMGVMEADIDSDVDARAVSEAGVKAIQIHTGGMCHLDAAMTRQGIDELGVDGMDIIVLENVGNLVCPAEFDTGATKNAMILSVPEGDDKPLKYPLMFQRSDALIINKIDALPFFDFDLDLCMERVRELNAGIEIFPLSAKTGVGMDSWFDWLRQSVRHVRHTEPELSRYSIRKPRQTRATRKGADDYGATYYKNVFS